MGIFGPKVTDQAWVNEVELKGVQMIKSVDFVEGTRYTTKNINYWILIPF